MKFPGPLENQRLSFLLEKAITREAQMWKVNVRKMPSNQNSSTKGIGKRQFLWMFLI
ncbi:cyclin I [Homo sapiens]|uniref:Cyclin I n=1 Tax=Homo sapiens TaxID=9606 RepID=D6RDK3_HUMAN|nr:cyclin I [Homo sapiens]KAI4025862.1 cyclin I [Homo sapiens]